MRAQGPVGATRARLEALLEEWPDHPLLTHLRDICDRMLDLPALGSPLCRLGERAPPDRPRRARGVRRMTPFPR